MGLLFFTLETSFSVGQTELRGPMDTAQTPLTACVNLKGGTTGASLSLSPYWSPDYLESLFCQF